MVSLSSSSSLAAAASSSCQVPQLWQFAIKWRSQSRASESSADSSCPCACFSASTIGAEGAGAVSFSAGSLDNRALKALNVDSEEASSFAFPLLRPRVEEAGIIDSRADSFFSGAEEVVVLPRFIEAFKEAISAFVRSRAVSLRVSGSGVGEGDGDGEGAVFVGAGAGFDVAADGGVGDLVGDFLRTGFSFGFDCSGA